MPDIIKTQQINKNYSIMKIRWQNMWMWTWMHRGFHVGVIGDNYCEEPIMLISLAN